MGAVSGSQAVPTVCATEIVRAHRQTRYNPLTPVRRLAYETYLIGQLSKLAQPDELYSYQHGTGDRLPLHPEAWSILNPWSSAWSEFADCKFTQAALAGLDDTSITLLACHLSDHHRNCIRRETSRHENWIMQRFTLDEAQVEYLEGDLKGVISQHGHQLLNVAQAPEVLSNASYKDRNPLCGVPYDVFLGRWKHPRQMRLIDGNHRAIQLTRQWLAKGGDKPLLSVVVPVV